ncbi:Uncharacterised protein [Pantoea agglomerans]|uniref:Uncharacterized protein n=1 Tax=Enterobacter agglomerans TaxID=549 RepID=A0A379AAR7_ENTAG|nr:Uncharacterised protein [Pantoea agglomerans]
MLLQMLKALSILNLQLIARAAIEDKLRAMFCQQRIQRRDIGTHGACRDGETPRQLILRQRFVLHGIEQLRKALIGKSHKRYLFADRNREHQPTEIVSQRPCCAICLLQADRVDL